MEKTERPIVEIETTPLDRSLQIIALLGMLASPALVTGYWPHLPAQIPTHFGFSGQPDDWGGRETIILLPAINLILWGLITVIGRTPRSFNYAWPITEANAGVQYSMAVRMLLILKTEVVLTISFLTWQVCRIGVGEAAALGVWFLLVFLVLILGTIVVYVIIARRYR